MRIAIIGCGKQAPKHIRGFRARGLEDIVVSDIDSARATALAEAANVRALPLQDVWADRAIDAIVIATPTWTHGALIHEAIESGKDFLCEKPLCATLAEARDAEHLARDRGRIGMVGFIYRSVPVFQEVHRLLSSGEGGALGALSLVLMRIGGRGSHEAWKHRRETAGGVVNEMLVHILDLVFWLFGAPVRMQVLASELRRPHRVIHGETVEADATDFVLLRLEARDGTAIYIEADMVTPGFTQRLEVQGEHGSLAASIQPEQPSYLFLTEPRAGFPAGRRVLCAAGEPYAAQAKTFMDAVRERRSPDHGRLDEACAVMRAVDDITSQMERMR